MLVGAPKNICEVMKNNLTCCVLKVRVLNKKGKFMAQKNLEKQLTQLLTLIGKLLRERMRNTLNKGGLHIGQARILEALLRNDKMNQGKIGKELQIKPATVTNQVKRMEATGLIKRTKNPKDDRFINVTLTQEGIKAAKYMGSVMIEVEEEVRESLTKKEIEILRKPLEKIRNRLTGLDLEK